VITEDNDTSQVLMRRREGVLAAAAFATLMLALAVVVIGTAPLVKHQADLKCCSHHHAHKLELAIPYQA
jgi:hypothetical protein